jgi:23S rRNA (uridine2552-2'-O)-methyltransferase
MAFPETKVPPATGDGPWPRSMKKSHSSKQWLRRHVNDPYVQRSKREGYRSRSAYKLTEIDERDRLFRPGQVVVDLGAAPGGWTQVAVQRVGARGRVVGIDLLAVEPVPGAEMIQADFTSRAGLRAVQEALGATKADLVLSDMAPNLSGIAVSDQARSMALAEAALEFALAHLEPGGAFLVKVFQGAGYDELLRAMRSAFSRVAVRKPRASRDESAEQYLLGRELKGIKPIVAIGK